MTRLHRFPHAPFAFMLAGSLALVAGAVVLTQTMHMAACPLCIVQRMLYLALATAAGLGLPLAGNALGRRLGALLTTVAAGAGAFVAGYQTWIQRFAPDTSCSGKPTWWEDLVDVAGNMMPWLFQSDGMCSDPGWIFLGLSIAEWSLVCFSAFLLVSLYTLLRR